SSRNTHTIYKIDRRSGAIIWRLGGKHSDFAIDPAAAFAWQHDARRQGNGTITLFDNGSSGASRALLLGVDEAARSVSLKRAYTRPSRTFADSQGNVQVLPNGNVLVGWGAQPYVSEFSPDGELLFDARLGEAYISYRAYRMQWDSDGSGTPAVATRRAATHTTAYVSWNGDTSVAHWTPLVGTTAGNLTARPAVARSGFETALSIPSGYTRLRVRGSDASGATVTTSTLLSI
ncbi:MAG TPA: arylsulfotransferase family protein, partial [Solirubrobacteraceae bacterium]